MREAGVDILVLCQYLRPSPKQAQVEKYYSESEFNELREIALRAGFLSVVAHPLARTSYKAKRAYLEAIRKLGSRGARAL